MDNKNIEEMVENMKKKFPNASDLEIKFYRLGLQDATLLFLNKITN